MRPRYWMLAPSMAGLLGTPALAGVEICNDTDDRQSVAIGYEAPGGGWVSEGWWGLDPGQCKTVMARALERQAFYYRATVGDGGFDGPFAFCVSDEAFTIDGDSDCAARGYENARFRKIETGGADPFTLTLVPDTEPHVTDRQATGGGTPGLLGEPVTMQAIFTGCETMDGLYFCGFEAEGWRWHAYAGSGTDDAVLDALWEWPALTPVEFEGDLVSHGDITVEIVLRRVTEMPGGDPYGALRADLQGLWRSVDDPRSTFRVVGADVYDYYDGDLTSHQLMQLLPACDGAEGLGIGLVRTELETQDGWCVIVSQVTAERADFTNPGRGNVLTYVKD